MQALVEDVELSVCDRASDRNRTRAQSSDRHFIYAATNDRFSWTILIDQPRRRRVSLPESKLLTLQRFAADDQCSRLRRRVLGINQLTQHFEMSGRDLGQAEIFP